jgi:hypothetical protein
MKTDEVGANASNSSIYMYRSIDYGKNIEFINNCIM